MSKKVKGREDYKRVATISANGDEKIGDLMADAMEKVGKEGVITVDEGKSTESTLEYTEGMAVRQGLPLALLPDQPDHARSRRWRTPTSFCTRRRSATSPSCSRC